MSCGSIPHFLTNCRWAKLAPPPEVRELTDSVVWEKECVGDDETPAKQLCFLVFLPDILDSKVGT
jgi:hypothetical protein